MRYAISPYDDFGGADDVVVLEADSPEAAVSKFADGLYNDDDIYVAPLGPSIRLRGPA